jgi:hypothetical protein
VIRYALACHNGHDFESWFQNSAAYEKQAKRGLIACPACNSTKVEKALMAPSLKRRDKSTSVVEAPAMEPLSPPAPDKAPVAMVSEQERELRSKLKELRDHLTSSADYVGPRFPDEARKMHYGDVEHRSIYGEASADDAKALAEEGIEFHPLPVLPEDRN